MKSKKPLSEAKLGSNAVLAFEMGEFYVARQLAMEEVFQPRNEAEQTAIDEYSYLTKLANGFKNLHGEEALPLLYRYEMRTSRMKGPSPRRIPQTPRILGKVPARRHPDILFPAAPHPFQRHRYHPRPQFRNKRPQPPPPFPHSQYPRQPTVNPIRYIG